jgi:hypothetical protein
MGNWSIIVETNLMYLCIQKHKYAPKTFQMIFSLYETWRYIEPYMVTMWLICKISFQKMSLFSKDAINVW